MSGFALTATPWGHPIAPADRAYATSGATQNVVFNRDDLDPSTTPVAWTGNRSICPWAQSPCPWGPPTIEGAMGFMGYAGAAAANYRGALDYARDAREPQGPTSGNRVGYVLWG